MLKISDGMCGMCKHFGKYHGGEELVQIRVNMEAPEDLVEECGNPTFQIAHLKVSATSSCDSYEPARKVN